MSARLDRIADDLAHDYVGTERPWWETARKDLGYLLRVARAADKLEESIAALIMDSEGVYGLHANGDPAPWEELMDGGRFEGWLGGFGELGEALADQEPDDER